MRGAMLALGASVALGAAAITGAHEGYAHAVGTVSLVEEGRVELTTSAKKTVSFRLTKETRYLRKGVPVDRSELKVGVRVVIDANKKADGLEAREIRFIPGPSPSPGGPK